MKKKYLIAGLTAAAVLSLSACQKEAVSESTAAKTATQADENVPGTDSQSGVFFGSAKGFGGIITATVTVEDGVIIDVALEGPDETEGIGTLALEQMADAILAAGSTDVDVISTATITSEAILEAVNNALNQEAAPEIETAARRTQVDMAADSVKTGFGAAISMADSRNAGDGDGLAKVDAYIAAVTVDGEGNIVAAKVDFAETEMAFTPEGMIAADEEIVSFLPKSAVDASWADEAAAFTASLTGLSQAEVEALETDDFNQGLIKAVVKAMEDSLSLGGNTADKLGLGIVTVMEYDQGSHTRDASDEKDGQAQAYSSYAAVTVNEEGIITSCIINASQGNVNFNQEGTLTTDLDTVFETKVEVGDKYGMKGRSEIGLEWYEQAFALADYMTGKTAAAVQDIAIADGKLVDEDVVTSVSIAVTDLHKAVLNAIDNAQ